MLGEFCLKQTKGGLLGLISPALACDQGACTALFWETKCAGVLGAVSGRPQLTVPVIWGLLQGAWPRGKGEMTKVLSEREGRKEGGDTRPRKQEVDLGCSPVPARSRTRHLTPNCVPKGVMRDVCDAPSLQKRRPAQQGPAGAHGCVASRWRSGWSLCC